MTCQNCLAVTTGASRGVVATIAEHLPKGDHKLFVSSAACVVTADAEVQESTNDSGESAFIHEAVSCNGIQSIRRDRTEGNFGPPDVLTFDASASHANQLIAKIHEFVIAIHGRTPDDGVIQVATSIFEMALKIESDLEMVANWYESDPIAALGGECAVQLVEKGESLKVRSFLESIGAMEADQINVHTLKREVRREQTNTI